MDKKKTDFDLSDWHDYCPKNIPCQQNGFDCGVFTCIFAEHVSKEAVFEFSQKEMVYFRQRMVHEILNGELM
jgi:sentrin-specific protease 1